MESIKKIASTQEQQPTQPNGSYKVGKSNPYKEDKKIETDKCHKLIKYYLLKTIKERGTFKKL